MLNYVAVAVASALLSVKFQAVRRNRRDGGAAAGEHGDKNSNLGAPFSTAPHGDAPATPKTPSGDGGSAYKNNRVAHLRRPLRTVSLSPVAPGVGAPVLCACCDDPVGFTLRRPKTGGDDEPDRGGGDDGEARGNLRGGGPKKPSPTNRKKRTTYLSWDDYFMSIAFLSAQRSKDPNKQVGACIVNADRLILGVGYTGFPRGCSDDALPWAKKSETGDPLETKYAYVCHAEMNAIMNKNSSNVQVGTTALTLLCASL